MRKKGFPDWILNVGDYSEALKVAFDYEAKAYNLAKLDAKDPGTGRRVWWDIERECERLAAVRNDGGLNSFPNLGSF